MEEHAKAPAAVVVIGASAGGLAAYQSFLEAIPPDSDLALILV
jgi:chemotaxis response regulator CheB